MSLQKPMMRGLLAKRLRFHLPIAFGLSFLAAIAFKYTVTEPRKQAYADFYKQYDAVIYLKNEELKNRTYHNFPEVYIIKEPFTQ